MGNVDQADVIVVGTGPAGATVAKELTEAGKRVTVLEWGRNKPLTGGLFQALGSVMIPGKNVLFTPEFAAVFRGVICGGSTIFYYGTAFDPPIEKFKKHGIDISNQVAAIRAELPAQPLKDELMSSWGR